VNKALRADILTCPQCNRHLECQGGSLVCAARHTFDIAREGYVNLLSHSRRPRGILGDSKAMLLARRRFLDRGYYQPMAANLSEIVADHLAGRRVGAGEEAASCVVDAGCGEGYYLGRIEEHLSRLSDLPHDRLYYVGVDLSKDAARLAASRYQAAQFAVADIRRRLPFADASVEVLLNLFAPRNASEFARIAVCGGLLAVAIPTDRHFHEVRARLLGTVPFLGIEEQKEQRVLQHLESAFAVQENRTVEYEVDLDSSDLVDLVAMTPSAWHLTPDDWERLDHVSGTRATVSCLIMTFHRRANGRHS
jgi:23S rRNA (guanine745-N1)-methyltransferase